MNPKELGKRLWGDAWVDPQTRKFKKGFPPPECQRTFVQFILEPMYKIYSQVKRHLWLIRVCSKAVDEEEQSRSWRVGGLTQERSSEGAPGSLRLRDDSVTYSMVNERVPLIWDVKRLIGRL